jgi:hypothetical protein
MSEIHFDHAGCEPARGPKAPLVFVRRGLRKLLKPTFARLAEVLQNLAFRVDAAHQRLDELTATGDSRHAAYSRQLDQAERYHAILFEKCDGLGGHLGGLSRDFLTLHAAFEARVAQVESLAASVKGINERLDDIDESIRAIQAFHWDHVALARRLAVVEDLLAVPTDAGTDVASLPFPGMTGERRGQEW